MLKRKAKLYDKMKKVYEEGEDIGVGTGRAAMHFLLSVGGGGTGSKSNDGGKGKKKGDDNNDNGDNGES